MLSYMDVSDILALAALCGGIWLLNQAINALLRREKRDARRADRREG